MNTNKETLNLLNRDAVNRINLFLTNEESLNLRQVNKFLQKNLMNPDKLRSIDFVYNLINQKQKIFKQLNLTNLKLKNINFIKGTQFWNCNLENTIFDNCNLEKAKFLLYTKLTNCQFLNCNLEKAKINYCDINFTNFKGSKLQKCDFYKSSYNNYTEFNNYINTNVNNLSLDSRYF